jgi:hypothetical protein
MAQQDTISILGPRDDGSYVVEFKTAGGERLAISVPGAKAALLKHFQSASAQLHAPTSVEGAMDGILKPKIKNVLGGSRIIPKCTSGPRRVMLGQCALKCVSAARGAPIRP